MAASRLLAAETRICSVSAAMVVDEDGTVGPPEFGDREWPTFLRIDPIKKGLTMLAPASRCGEVTKFDTVHEVDGVVWSVFGQALREGEAAQPSDAKAEQAVAEPAP